MNDTARSMAMALLADSLKRIMTVPEVSDLLSKQQRASAVYALEQYAEVTGVHVPLAAPASDGLRSALERAESDLHLVTLHGDVVGMHREAMAAKKRVRAALDQPQSGKGGE